MTEYKITYELDSEGWWVASAVGIRGCHTQGRSISQARKRIRQALELFEKNVEESSLIDDIKLPKDLKRLVSKAKSARSNADQQHLLAQQLTQNAALTLIRDVSLSRRDAAEILGLSHQRVQQLLDESLHF